MSYLEHLRDIAENDVSSLNKAQESYGDSWMKRGGTGAFMMLARKWDRLENQLKGDLGAQWDIFHHALVDDRPEGIIDDIRDLRRYLMLVEAQVLVLQQEEKQ